MSVLLKTPTKPRESLQPCKMSYVFLSIYSIAFRTFSATPQEIIPILPPTVENCEIKCVQFMCLKYSKLHIDFCLVCDIIISGRIEEGGYFSAILSGRVRLPPKKAHGAHYRFRFYRLTSRAHCRSRLHRTANSTIWHCRLAFVALFHQ